MLEKKGGNWMGLGARAGYALYPQDIGQRLLLHVLNPPHAGQTARPEERAVETDQSSAHASDS